MPLVHSIGRSHMDEKEAKQKICDTEMAKIVKKNGIEIGIYIAALRAKVKSKNQEPQNYPDPECKYSFLSTFQIPAFQVDSKSPVLFLSEELGWEPLPEEMTEDWKESPKIEIFEWAQLIKAYLCEEDVDTFDEDTASNFVLTKSHEHLRDFFAFYELALFLLRENTPPKPIE